MFDTHTHCKHSHDSKEEPIQMIEHAISLGMDYIAFTDHFDGELTFLPEFDYIPQIDLQKHFEEITSLKEQYKGRIEIGVGLECGYMKEANNLYLSRLNNFNTDIIIILLCEAHKTASIRRISQCRKRKSRLPIPFR